MGEPSKDRAAADAQKKQSKKKVAINGTKQYQLHVEFQNLLRTILVRPQLWLEEQLQYLRNFVLTVSQGKDRHKFAVAEGDETLPVADENEPPAPPATTNFIKTLAEGGNIADDIEPVLLVLDRKTGFRDHMQHRDYKKQKVKVTHLTLVDGDNNTIHARLATHLADIGRQLIEGDIIKLGLFTPLTYHVNDSSPLMPALFIVQYTQIGHASVPLDTNSMLCCSVGNHPTKEVESMYNIPDPLTQKPPECTYEKRLCRKYGVNFIGQCICKEIPVGERKLDIIAEDCYLIDAPDGVDKLPNKSKRLMLYWWYATNVYSLTGKGNRGKLPDCLEYAIKKEYPEKSSADWTGYKDGKKKRRTN